MREYYDDKERRFVIMCGPADKTAPSYPLAVRDQFIAEGFLAEEADLEIDAEITKLLENYPDDVPEKGDILGRLPSMYRLQKTSMLQELRREERDMLDEDK